MVRLNGSGELAFGVAREPEPFIQGEAEEGDILEVNPTAHRLVYELAGRLASQGGVALFIDYGHGVTGLGDTLQALRAHDMVDPLVDPGEADITAHVDFAAMARSASAAGAAVYGPIDQGDFLRAIGIDSRTRALVERSPERASEFEFARDRLAGKGEGRNGRAVQGDGDLQSRAAGAARIRIAVTCGREPQVGRSGRVRDCATRSSPAAAEPPTAFTPR